MAATFCPQILLAEDDAVIGDFMRRGLSLEGFGPRVVPSGQAAVSALRSVPIDLVLLDMVLPDMDGLDVCRSMRSFSEVPIIALTARDGVESRVAGLEAGADDYVVKPFAFVEVVARIRSALRRTSPRRAEPLNVGDLTLHPLARTVRRRERTVRLSKREFDLLELLARNAGHVVTRDVILERVWGTESASLSDPVKVYISYLRQKLNQCGEPDLIRSVRGLGYVMEAE